jgi:hypothetical protein
MPFCSPDLPVPLSLVEYLASKTDARHGTMNRRNSRDTAANAQKALADQAFVTANRG